MTKIYNDYVSRLPALAKSDYLLCFNELLREEKLPLNIRDWKPGSQTIKQKMSDLNQVAISSMRVSVTGIYFAIDDKHGIGLTLEDVFTDTYEDILACNAEAVTPVYKLTNPPKPIGEKRLVDKTFHTIPLFEHDGVHFEVALYGGKFIFYIYDLQDATKDAVVKTSACLPTPTDPDKPIDPRYVAMCSAACLIFGIYN